VIFVDVRRGAGDSIEGSSTRSLAIDGLDTGIDQQRPIV
jgi:hypothetical protein